MAKRKKKKSWFKILTWSVIVAIIIGGVSYGVVRLVKYINNKNDTSQSEEEKENQEDKIQATAEYKIAEQLVACA